MDWSNVPILIVAIIGLVGVFLMIAAFALIARRGGWQQAMQPDAPGRWPLPRYLMLIGALLGCLFPVLMSVPGVVPWWDYSNWYTEMPALAFFLSAALVGLRLVVRRRRDGA